MTTIADSAERLEPCPCCGGTASFDHDDDGWNWIVCGSCGLSTDCAVSAMDDCRPSLREKWNRRAPAEAGAPSGWKLVPEILTTEMHNAAVKKDNEALDDSGKPASIEGLWLAMLAAAPAAPKPSAFQSAGGALPDGMSARQGAVLALVRQGKSNKCIARELEITESTVKGHVAVVMRKLGARNRTEVAVKAASRGCA